MVWHKGHGVRGTAQGITEEWKESVLHNTYFSRWWVWMVRGILAILFGILTFIVPTATLAVLILLFGIWAIVDGFTHLALAFRSTGGHAWLLGFEGMIGLAAGFFAIFYPLHTGLALLYVIAIWAIITGVARLALAIRQRHQEAREWTVGLSGVLAILFGVIVLLFPVVGVVAVALAVGIYALVAGIVFVGLSLRMHAARKRAMEHQQHEESL